jgi:hypothetical protein
MLSSHSAFRIPHSALPTASKPRDNPFRSERIDTLPYRPQGWTWDELLARLETLDRRAAVVGPHGSGKTTLLASLIPRLEARGFACRAHRLRRSDRNVPQDLLAGLTERHILVLDGADLLGRLAWRRVRRAARAAGGLIVACHRPNLLPTLVQCTTRVELLGALVRELHPDATPAVTGSLPALFEKHGGDLRAALRELYDARATR